MPMNHKGPWICSLAVLTMCLAGRSLPDRPWLLYNHTPSVPLGWYIYQNKRVERGNLAAFRLPRSAHRYAMQRGESTDILLLKPIAAIAGDHVSTLNNELRINGTFVCTIPTCDTQGRMLPRWHDSRVLQNVELFFYSAQIPNSFDSRFFGPIHTDDVLGVYRKVGLPSRQTVYQLPVLTPSNSSESDSSSYLIGHTGHACQAYVNARAMRVNKPHCVSPM